VELPSSTSCILKWFSELLSSCQVHESQFRFRFYLVAAAASSASLSHAVAALVLGVLGDGVATALVLGILGDGAIAVLVLGSLVMVLLVVVELVKAQVLL
jgi:sugar (pentulose or hexulose) kinase